MEHELEDSSASATQNAVFDETGHFLIYSTLLGIKIVNIETNRVVRVSLLAECWIAPAFPVLT